MEVFGYIFYYFTTSTPSSPEETLSVGVRGFIALQGGGPLVSWGGRIHLEGNEKLCLLSEFTQGY